MGVMPAGGGAAAHGAAGRHPGPCWKGGENIWGAGEGEAPAADDRGASLAASSKHGRRGAPLVKGPGAAAAAARGPWGHQSHSNTIECAPLDSWCSRRGCGPAVGRHQGEAHRPPGLLKLGESVRVVRALRPLLSLSP